MNQSHYSNLHLIPCGRVSSDEQAAEDKTSLEDQVARTTEYIQNLGATALEPITDDISGDLPLVYRPGGKHILRLLDTGQADGCVFLSVSRYFRDDLEGRLQVRKWIQQGRRLFLVDHREVKDDSEIGFLLKSWQASQERKDIRDRTTGGRRRNPSKGKIVNANLPFWLKKDGKGGAKLGSSHKVRLAKQIHQWIVNDHLTLRAVQTKLNNAGIPSPHGKRWHVTTIARVIAHEALCGWLTYGRFEVTRKRNEVTAGGSRRRQYAKRANDDPNVFRLKVPALISRADWLKGIAILKANKEDARRNAKYFYMLRGRLIRCPDCNRTMVGGTSGVHPDKKSLQYRCPVCNKSVSAKRIEAWVWNEVLALMTDEAEFKAAIQEAFHQEQEQYEPRRHSLADVVATIREVEREADEIGRALRRAKGIVQKRLQQQQDLVNEQWERLNVRKAELEAEVAHAMTEDDLQAFYNFRADSVEGIETATPEEKHDLLRMLGAQVEVFKGKIKLSLVMAGLDKTVGRDEIVYPLSGCP